MQQFWQFLQNIPVQVWFIIGVFFFSALSAVGKKLSELKQARAIQQERQRRMNEAMRTGRPIPDPSEEQAAEVEARKQRLAELQKRREAQLEELRRRRQEMLARQRSGTATQGPTPTQQQPQQQPQLRPQPSARVTPQGRPLQTPRQTPPRATPQRVARPVQQRPHHQRSHSVSGASQISDAYTARTGDPNTEHATLHARETIGDLSQHSLTTSLGGAAALPVKKVPRPGKMAITGRDDLRRAIVLSEILGKPTALRDDRLREFG